MGSPTKAFGFAVVLIGSLAGLGLGRCYAGEALAGEIRLTADARDLRHRVISVREVLPITGAGGDLALLYPQWIPGDHAPSGPIGRLAGLTITIDGARQAWMRDPRDAFAFHVQTPAGDHRLALEFQYLAPSADVTDGAVMTRDIVAINWPYLVLYPKGVAAAAINIRPELRLADGFQWSSALAPEPGAGEAGAVSFAPVSLSTLVDSPVYAGDIIRRYDLDPGAQQPVRMTLFSDRPERTSASAEQLAWHRALVREADALFGSRPFDHYDLLITLSAPFGEDGLEHRRSSEVFLNPDHLTDWAASWDSRYLLAHEFVHAWNGKWRVPAGLVASDFNTDLNTDLLWVYEGQTQYWAKVLSARAGLWTRQQMLDDLALDAAEYAGEPAAAWRALGDSVRDPVVNPRSEVEWRSWQRFQDYYDEGALVWLDADTLIRQQTQGRRSLDDFARDFFAGGRETSVQTPYRRADVVAALNRIAPYDWDAFFADRIDKVGAWDPLEGLRRGGYGLVYTDEPGPTCPADTARRGLHCYSTSIGLVAGADGTIESVTWQGPAFRAGLAAGMTLISIDGRSFTPERLTAAIVAAKSAQSPIAMVVQDQERVEAIALDYHDGPRYPHLTRNRQGTAMLDLILQARAKAGR